VLELRGGEALLGHRGRAERRQGIRRHTTARRSLRWSSRSAR
jgi:hypothetical protein